VSSLVFAGSFDEEEMTEEEIASDSDNDFF
jgi:hypothetical protein